MKQNRKSNTFFFSSSPSMLAFYFHLYIYILHCLINRKADLISGSVYSCPADVFVCQDLKINAAAAFAVQIQLWFGRPNFFPLCKNLLERAIFHTSSSKAFLKKIIAFDSWIISLFPVTEVFGTWSPTLLREGIWIDVTNVKQGQLSDVSQSLLVHFCTLHFQGIMMHSHHT